MDLKRRLHHEISMLAHVLTMRRLDGQGHHPETAIERAMRVAKGDDASDRQNVAVRLQDELCALVARLGKINGTNLGPSFDGALRCVWFSKMLAPNDRATLSVAWLSAVHVQSGFRRTLQSLRRRLLCDMHLQKRHRALELRSARGVPNQWRARRWLRRIVVDLLGRRVAVRFPVAADRPHYPRRASTAHAAFEALQKAIRAAASPSTTTVARRRWLQSLARDFEDGGCEDAKGEDADCEDAKCEDAATHAARVAASVQFLLGEYGPRALASRRPVPTVVNLPIHMLAQYDEIRSAQQDSSSRERAALFQALILHLHSTVDAQHWRALEATAQMAAFFVDPRDPPCDDARAVQRFAFTWWRLRSCLQM